jgi:hypothetical protein
MSEKGGAAAAVREMVALPTRRPHRRRRRAVSPRALIGPCPKYACVGGLRSKTEAGQRHKGASLSLREAQRSGDSKTIVAAAITAIGWYGSGSRLPVTLAYAFEFGLSSTALEPDQF